MPLVILHPHFLLRAAAREQQEAADLSCPMPVLTALVIEGDIEGEVNRLKWNRRQSSILHLQVA